MNYRNRLAELAGTGKMVGFHARSLGALYYWGRILRVGLDYIDFERVDEHLEVIAITSIPISEITWLDIEPVHIQRKLFKKCLNAGPPSQALSPDKWEQKP